MLKGETEPEATRGAPSQSALRAQFLGEPRCYFRVTVLDPFGAALLQCGRGVQTAGFVWVNEGGILGIGLAGCITRFNCQFMCLRGIEDHIRTVVLRVSIEGFQGSNTEGRLLCHGAAFGDR